MTVGDLIKRLEKIDKDKMCIHKERIEDKGWANLDMKEEDIDKIVAEAEELKAEKENNNE